MSRELSGEVVMVPVPVELLGPVYQFLGRRMVENGADSGARGETGSSLPFVPWTTQDIVRLKSIDLNPASRAMLDLASAAPGTPVRFDAVVEHLGCTVGQARSQLGGFTKMVRRTFGRDNWPCVVGWDGTGIIYTLDEQTARWWRDV